MSVAVAGSNNSFTFGVVHFADQGAPSVAEVDPEFDGCVVAMEGDLVAAGNIGGGEVSLFRITDPSAPIPLGTLDTPLLGISAIAIAGNRLVAAESNGQRLAFINVANPASPALLGTKVTGIASISALAVASSRAVIAGPNDFTFEIVDFSNPANATIVSHDAQMQGALTLDFDGTRIAVGAAFDSVVKLFSAGGSISEVGSFTTQLGGVTSVALDGTSVAVSSANDFNVVVITFSGTPTSFAFNPGLGGGCSLARNSNELACGAILGEEIKRFTLSGNTATPAGSIDSNVPSIASLALDDFNVVVVPKEAKIEVTPNPLQFPAIAACKTSTKPLTVRNTGTKDLVIAQSQVMAPFSVSPAGQVTIKPHKTNTLSVTFNPEPDVAGSAGRNLTITSNAVNAPSLVVALGAQAVSSPPQITAPSTLFLGACLANYFYGKRLTIANASECETLQISQLTSTSPAFLITNDAPVTLPSTTTIPGHAIPAKGSRSYIVVFAPTVVGDFNAELRIASNDPKSATTVVKLTGVAVEAVPTSFCLVMDYSRSMVQSHQGQVSKLKTVGAALNLFLDLLPVGEGDEIAKVGFRKEAALLVQLAPVTPEQIEQCRTEKLTYRFYSAIGEGLHLGLTTIYGAKNQRRVILVFSDGMQNYGMPLQDVLALVEGLDVEVYAVGIGSGTDIDAELLSDIAISSGGRFFAGDDTLTIRKDFVQVLADAFRMEMAADPDYVIVRGGTIDVPFELTQCENRVRFACTWEETAEQLQVKLVAPDGMQYTASSAATNRLVRYSARGGYACYTLSFPPIDGVGAIGPHVVGKWTLRVSAAGLQAEQQRFAAAMVVESDLEVDVDISQLVLGSSAQLLVTARHRGVAIDVGDVEVDYREPLLSAGELLSDGLYRDRFALEVEHTTFDRDDDDRDAEKREEDGGDERRHNPGEPPPLPLTRIPTRRLRLAATRRERDGRLHFQLPAFARDGLHEAIIQIRIPTCGGIATRYRRLVFAPRRALSAIETTVTIAQSRANARLATITVVPRDTGGNRLGPGRAKDLRLASAPGVTVLRTIDRLDGSYDFVVSGRTTGGIQLTYRDSVVQLPELRPSRSPLQVSARFRPERALPLLAVGVGMAALGMAWLLSRQRR
jgi:hypothetical protein